MEGGAHRVDGHAGVVPPAEGAEIARPVIFHPAAQGEAGIGLVLAQAHKRVALVVLEKDVVAGLVVLDEGVFQHQRLKFRGDEDGVETIHLRYHGPGFGVVGRTALEILGDPVFQFFCLAYVDDLTGFVHHQIDAGGQWQIVGLLPQLVACHGAPPSAVFSPV